MNTVRKERMEKLPEVRLERMARQFRRFGDGYIMLERALTAFEEYQRKAEELKQNGKLTPPIEHALGRIEERELATLFKGLEDVEKPIEERYRGGAGGGGLKELEEVEGEDDSPSKAPVEWRRMSRVEAKSVAEVAEEVYQSAGAAKD